MTTSAVAMPAEVVHEELVRSLNELRAAEKRAVLWFAEVVNRRLYEQLGFASIYEYASRALSFSRSKTAQFIRLARSFEQLPAVRAAVEQGDLSWTKARELVSVATPATETRWLDAARTRSRRELSRAVSQAKAAARASVEGDRQVTLVGVVDRANEQANQSTVALPEPTMKPLDAAKTVDSHGPSDRQSHLPVVSPDEVPVTLSFRLSVEQAGRIRACLERIRKCGRTDSRDELLSEAFEMLAAVTMQRRAAERRNAGSAPTNATDTVAYVGPVIAAARIVTYVCAKCGGNQVPTPRGGEPLPLATLSRQMCDAEIVHPGARRRRTLTDAQRTRVLARDGHRCRVEGCAHTLFLDVHHIRPVSRGGTNSPDNLITLCRSCHRRAHEKESLSMAATRVQVGIAPLAASPNTDESESDRARNKPD